MVISISFISISLLVLMYTCYSHLIWLYFTMEFEFLISVADYFEEFLYRAADGQLFNSNN